MWKLVFFLVISIHVHSLEINDSIKNVNVIKHYNNNVLVLNRGLEDAINKYDHIKLTNRNGYIARAVCIKTTMLLSYWKVYRVVNPDLLSYDSTYVLRSMLQSSLPRHIKRYVMNQKKKENPYIEGEELSDEDLKKSVILQQDRIANFDLANDVSKSDISNALSSSAQNEDEPSSSSSFIKNNFNKRKLNRDLDRFNIRIFASPANWQTQNDQKNLYYGFKVYNSGNKYDFSLLYEKNETKIIDQFSDQEVSSSSSLTEFEFTVKRITDDWSYFSFISNQQATLGSVNAPAQATQLGLLGFRYHAFSENSPTLFNVSYITAIDNLETERRIDNNGSTSFITNKENNARHMFRINYQDNINKLLRFETQFTYAPLINLKEQKMKWDDNKTRWDTNFTYQLSKNFSATYQYIYINDIRRKDDLSLDPVNQINSFNFNYLIEL